MVVYKNLDVATAEMDRQAEMFSVLEEKIEESTHQIQEAHRAFNELPSNWKGKLRRVFDLKETSQFSRMITTGSAKDSNSLVERLAQLQTAVEREMEEKERELQRVRDETNVSTSRLHETM